MPNVFSADLASAQYSTAAQVFVAQWDMGLARPGNVSSKTGLYFDGDFSNAEPVGHHLVSFPFADKGDAVTEIMRQRYWQLATSFKSQALGTPAISRPDLLLIDEENFRDEGAGIISWDRVYSSLPRTRDEFEDYAYSAQYMYAQSGSTTLAEKVFSVPSKVRYEYFLQSQLAHWDILLALRVEQLTPTEFRKRGHGNLTLQDGLFVSTDALIVAEDSKLKLWKYPFMYRATRYIAGPTLAFWGDSISF